MEKANTLTSGIVENTTISTYNFMLRPNIKTLIPTELKELNELNFVILGENFVSEFMTSVKFGSNILPSTFLDFPDPGTISIDLKIDFLPCSQTVQVYFPGFDHISNELTFKINHEQ